MNSTILTRGLLSTAAVTLVIGCSYAQKVLEKSSPKRPEWVYGLERDFLIVEGVGSTHELARQEALLQLKDKIVQSVAVNVSSEVQMDVNEQVINGLFQYKESTSIKTNITSDFLMALKGVSLNKANAYYWERIRNKDKEQDIHYHVKYPFSESELNKLIKDWEQLDGQLLSEIQLIDKDADRVATLEGIALLQNQIAQLQKLLTGAKKTQAGLVKSKVDKLVEGLKFEQKSHTQGMLIVDLVTNSRRITGYDLLFTSSCAKSESITVAEEVYTINYSYNFCSPSNLETITLSTSSGGVTVTQNFGIPIGDLAKITLNGSIKLITGGSNSQRWILPIRSFNNFGFKISKVEITVERSGQRILSNFTKNTYTPTFFQQNIEQEFKGTGDYPVEFVLSKKTSEVDDMINAVLKLKVNYSASGKVYYYSENSDRQIVYQFEKIPMDVH